MTDILGTGIGFPLRVDAAAAWRSSPTRTTCARRSC